VRLSVWRIYRRIGVSGGSFINMLLRETGLDLDPDRGRPMAGPWRQSLFP